MKSQNALQQAYLYSRCCLSIIYIWHLLGSLVIKSSGNSTDVMKALNLTEHQSNSQIRVSNHLMFTWVLTWPGSCLCRQFTARQLTEFPNRAIQNKSESMTNRKSTLLLLPIGPTAALRRGLTEDIMWSQYMSCLWAWNCRQDGWWAIN